MSNRMKHITSFTQIFHCLTWWIEGWPQLLIVGLITMSHFLWALPGYRISGVAIGYDRNRGLSGRNRDSIHVFGRGQGAIIKRQMINSDYLWTRFWKWGGLIGRHVAFLRMLIGMNVGELVIAVSRGERGNIDCWACTSNHDCYYSQTTLRLVHHTKT